ncbi:MAG TPA: PAS domain S-box protein [Nitrospira sp.]|nr:PAS domain S-box protein [Nitrospira sp.]
MIPFTALRSHFTNPMSALACALSLAVGMLALLGWVFDISPLGLAIFAATATVSMVILLWWTARFLSKVDRRRWQTALALSQSEEGQRLAWFAVDHSGDAILWADMKQRFIYANDAACRSLGYNPDEIRNLTIADIVPHDEQQRYMQRLTLLKQGQPAQYESLHRRQDGSRVPVEVSLNYLEHQGKGYICVMARDIEERSSAEEALLRARDEIDRRVEERTATLRANQPRLELILDATAVATWDWDVTTGALRCNEQWAANRGLSIDEVDPHVSAWSEGVHPDDRVHMNRALQDCLEGMTTSYEAEMRVRTAAGEWTWIMERGRVIERDGEGKPLLMAGIEIDITARKRAEEELKRAQAFVLSVLENIPHMLFIKDAKDLRFVQLNKAGEDLLGYGRDELIGKRDHDFFPRDEADHFTKKDREVLESGHLIDIPDEPIQTKQRGVRILHTKKIPLFDATGKPQYLLGISEDITERKLVEEALQASEERYSSLVSQATDIIYTAGLDGRFTFVNAAACAIMEYQEAELVGKHYLELIRPDFREAAQRCYKQQLLERTPSTYFEFPTITKHGREVWFGQRVQLRVAQGQILGVEAIARDITERKRAEEALRESEERFAKIFQSSPHAVIITELATGRLVDVNRACTDIFGYDREEIIGRTTLELGHWAEAETRQRFVETIRQQGGVRNIEMALPTKFGTIRHFLVSAEAIVLNGTDCLVIMGNDITDRKRAEAALKEAYERLQAVTRQLAAAEEGERQRIARELHDEFGQVLTGLKFDVAWLSNSISRMRGSADVAAMTSKVAAMSQSVDGLIQSVRATAAALRPSVLDDLGLVAAIEWLVATFRERTGLPSELAIDPKIQERSIEPEVATTVFRSAQELLTNVMRHAQASAVSVRLTMTDRDLNLTVRDDGRGIQGKEWEEGRSLGLRGVHERVKLIGGSVTITGSSGAGTEVSLSLPIEKGIRVSAKERV